MFIKNLVKSESNSKLRVFKELGLYLLNEFEFLKKWYSKINRQIVENTKTYWVKFRSLDQKVNSAASNLKIKK